MEKVKYIVIGEMSIPARQLAKIYGVKYDECIFIDTKKELRGIREEKLKKLIKLTFRWEGDYKVHLKELLNKSETK